MKIVVRKMTEDDIDHVHRIESKIFHDPWPELAFRSDIKSEFAIPLVATLEDRIYGYACLYHAVDEIQIGNFAVAPEYQQRGIGQNYAAYNKSGLRFERALNCPRGQTVQQGRLYAL